MNNDNPPASSPSARASRRSAGLHGIITLVIFGLMVVIINYLSFKHYSHVDLSQSQFYALSPKTTDVLKSLDSPVVAHSYLSATYEQPIENLLKEYERVGGKNFTVDKVDPVYDPQKAEALQKRLQFDGNQHQIILEYKGHTHAIKEEDLYELNPMTQQVGAFKGEQQITSALVALVEGKASKIYFTEGHGEHSVQDMQTGQGYGAVGLSLKNENIETDNLNIAAKGEVPADADAVVIAGPQEPFSPSEAQAIDHYLANNGKIIVLLDPYATLGFEDVLKRYGLQFDNDVVLSRAIDTTGQQITAASALFYQGGFSSHPITQKFAEANLDLQIDAARSITMLKGPNGAANPKVQFLLQTDPSSWGWVLKPGASPMTDPSSLTFNKATDIPGPVTVAAVYDGGTITDPKTQAIVPAARIVAIGSASFLQNASARPVGLNFFTNAVDWLVKKQAVLDIAPKIPQQYEMSLSPLQTNTVVWTALIVVPGIALVLALFTWLSRRK